MMRHLATLLLLVLAPLTAAAQEPQRHTGFFIRPELGFGYFAAGASQNGLDLSITGSGPGLALAIGGAVSENFIIGGQVWDYIASKPTVTLKGGGLDLSATADADAGLVGYGVFLNWYFMPSNMYLAVTPSLTRLVSTDGTDTATSDWGFGVRGAFGKEWWVSDNWGLGLAASLALSSNKDSGAGAPTIGTFCIGLSFSATYN